MSEGFLGQIIMFGGSFAPRGWALCNGQLLSINQYQALFSILGTTYGGDGINNFALPDLRGRLPVHVGTGPGLSNRRLGEQGGFENVPLNVNNLPSHNHPTTGTVRASTDAAETQDPNNAVPALTQKEDFAESANVTMGANSVAATVDATGGNQAHTNLQPYATVSYIICLEGIFPSRS